MRALAVSVSCIILAAIPFDRRIAPSFKRLSAALMCSLILASPAARDSSFFPTFQLFFLSLSLLFQAFQPFSLMLTLILSSQQQVEQLLTIHFSYWSCFCYVSRIELRISSATITLCAPSLRRTNSFDNLGALTVSSTRLVLSFAKVFLLSDMLHSTAAFPLCRL